MDSNKGPRTITAEMFYTLLIIGVAVLIILLLIAFIFIPETAGAAQELILEIDHGFHCLWSNCGGKCPADGILIVLLAILIFLHT